MDDETYIQEADNSVTLITIQKIHDLNKNIKEGLIPSESRRPKFYLLPKIHKRDLYQ